MDWSVEIKAWEALPGAWPLVLLLTFITRQGPEKGWRVPTGPCTDEDLAKLLGVEESVVSDWRGWLTELGLIRVEVAMAGGYMCQIREHPVAVRLVQLFEDLGAAFAESEVREATARPYDAMTPCWN